MQNMKLAIAMLMFFFCGINAAYGAKLPKWFPLDTEKALDEWEEKIFKGRVLYKVNAEEKDAFLLARSNKNASGIYTTLKFDVKDNPFVSWRWRVITFPEKIPQQNGDGWIEKDDYAARFYVIFPGLSYTSTTCLEYVWDEAEPDETIATSPYFKNIKIIVAESGRKNLGKWVFEERNVYEDYIKAFGKEPRRRAGAIALMTDTDNTLSTAEANYDDITVGYKQPKGADVHDPE